jgi:hypothetical protein
VDQLEVVVFYFFKFKKYFSKKKKKPNLRWPKPPPMMVYDGFGHSLVPKGWLGCPHVKYHKPNA